MEQAEEAEEQAQAEEEAQAAEEEDWVRRRMGGQEGQEG
jgi:hypothetical protein